MAIRHKLRYRYDRKFCPKQNIELNLLFSFIRIEFPTSFDMVTGECIEIECSNQTRRTNSGGWCTNPTNAYRRMHRRLCRWVLLCVVFAERPIRIFVYFNHISFSLGPTDTPTLDISFRYNGTQQKLSVKLPLTINKFFEPTEMNGESFFARWKNLGG